MRHSSSRILNLITVFIVFFLVLGDKHRNFTTTSNKEVPGEKTDEKEDLYSVKITGIKCYNIDPTAFTNVTCNLKAVRGLQGVVNLFFVYNNVSKLSTTYQLFYRNSSGRYMNYLIDITVDYCKILSGNLNIQQVAIKLFVNLFNKYDTAILHGCPLNGVGNYTNFEFDKVKKSILPNIIPAGDFIFYAKNFNTETKRPLFDLKATVNVKSKTIMQLDMLNMG